MYLLGKLLEFSVIVVSGVIAIPIAIMLAMLRGFMYFAGGFLFGAARGIKKWKF